MDRTRVPRHADALRTVVREQLEEHVREAEQRVRREALARRELLREREERAVGEVVAVDEEELGVARRPVVELQLRPGERLRRHRRPTVSSAPDARARPRTLRGRSRRGGGGAPRERAAPPRGGAAPACRLRDPRRSAAAVEGAWSADGRLELSRSATARLVGYLVAAPRPTAWGPNVWVETGGHAVEEPEPVRDLYAFAAARGSRRARRGSARSSPQATQRSWMRGSG